MIRGIISHITLILILFCSFAYADKPNNSIRDKNAKRPKDFSSKYAGKVNLSEERFDFGYLPNNSKVSYTFWLRNDGQDSLEIIEIKPG